MNRFEEIDSFLKYFSEIVRENPNFSFNSDTFYGEFMSYDLANNERSKLIRNMFGDWINNFKHKENIDVFWDKRQGRFLQFRNNKGNGGKEYKLYLSFLGDKMYNAVNLIFDFIEKNDIEHYSKVADIVRADSIVLRITNKDDMKKVVNFINSNSFLTQNARKTNPFLMRNGVVGFAYDDTESFNSFTTQILDVYFKEVKKNKNFERVSIQNFSAYLNKLYFDTFIDMNNIENFNNNISYHFPYYKNDAEKLLNFKHMAEFLKNCVNRNFSLDDYSNFVEDCRDKQKSDNDLAYIDNKIKEKEHAKMKNLFFEACCCTCKKYNSDQLVFALKHALNGSYDAFSNGNEGFFYRKQLKRNVPSSNIKELCFEILNSAQNSFEDINDLLYYFADYINSFVNSHHR